MVQTHHFVYQGSPIGVPCVLTDVAGTKTCGLVFAGTLAMTVNGVARLTIGRYDFAI